jgi:hypothetical protein
MKRFLRLLAFTVLAVVVGCAALYVVVRYRFGVYFAGAVGSPESVGLQLPPGFHDVYARGLSTPRPCARTAVFVAEMGAGRNVALRAAGAPVLVADGLERPPAWSSTPRGVGESRRSRA